MKASIRWLRELCPSLPDDASAIASRLTSAGLEVEGSSAFGLGAEACLVAAVVATRPHPSRSGLRLVTVDRGQETIDVVCGAPNVPDTGGLVVLAPLGAHLPAKGMTIEARAVGGVTSEGMLCSEAELCLGPDADGILVLPAGTAAPGARLALAVPAARDTILEIGLTPNRPDGLGHVGIARDAAALFGVPFAPPAPRDPERTRDEPLDHYASITIDDAEGCPHYGAAALVDVRVAPSPLDVRWRLASLDVRPISNVVDVTNLVMFERGHPMHAFDLDRLRGGAVVVRRARAGERMTTLDGIDRALDVDDLVVCDGDGPVALAGVMGGGESEIASSTQRILLECAYFDARTVRRTARRHGLHTEASHRFERGIDWGDTRVALARAASLISTIAGATVVTPARVVEAKALPRTRVTLRHRRIQEVLGVDFEAPAIHETLGRLGFERQSPQADPSHAHTPAAAPGDGGFDVWEVPSFRPDVSREVDLVEEVGRMRGYDAIPTALPAVRASRDAGPRQALARRTREAAVSLGLTEAVTFAFVAPRDLEAVGAREAAVTLRNPLGEESAVMRTSLLPGLLRAVSRASRHGERDAGLFAVGPLFLPPPPESPSLPEERLAFAAVLAGERTPWLGKGRPVDVWDAKGVAQALVMRLVRREAAVVRAAEQRPAALHPRGAAWIDVDGRRVGSFGPLHPDVREAFEIDQALVALELDLRELDAIGPRPLRFSPLSRFPAVSRDLAVVVDAAVPAGDVEHAVRDAAGDLAEQVTLFDRFQGGSVPAGRASLAFHVVYRAADRTLTDSEVDTRHTHVLAEVEKRFGATLRS
ncbi:MAG: phenylalanine--tRNA ligase subunit beta [Polyangiaceae bacterium]|nr:phenylalanine--tRNA ligase subunit beta [Polyangiaceae bacterium]